MQVNENVFRDILRLFIWFPFRWAVKLLPTGAGIALIRALGDLHFLASRGRKKRLMDAMAPVLDGTGLGPRGAARKYFENHYVDRLHIFLYPKLKSKESLKRHVRFENIEVLDEALKAGKGALLVQPHFGPVQLTLLALSIHGYDPIQIGYLSKRGLSRIGRAVAFRYRVRYESMLPQIIQADGFLGKAHRHLAKGGVVLTTGDGAGGGVFIGEQKPFEIAGRKRPFPLGPATWALRTGAAYIPTFIVPEGAGRYKVIFEPPISGMHDDPEKDRLYITGRFIDAMKKYLAQYPYCWHFWDEA